MTSLHTDGRAFSSCSSTRPAAAAVLPRLPRPRQHHQHRVVSRKWGALQNLLFAVLLSVLFCCQGVEGRNLHAHLDPSRAELVYDRSEAPTTPRMRLQARQDASSRVSPTASEISSPSSTGDTAIQSVTPLGVTPLPQPFDTSLGNNFTSPSCPQFFNDFLTNATFKECLPFSLLLQTSNSFFTSTHSPVHLTQTLTATCSVNFSQCSDLMSSLATQIRSHDICGADLSLENPLVTQAYAGLLAYQPLYHAGCLTDSGGSYCFANAVSNASSPTSSYIYYLPLGVQLPGGTRPACNACLKDTMAIFAAAAAANESLPISGDYGQAAQMVDLGCGPNFVQAGSDTSSAAGGRAVGTGGVGFLALVVVLLSCFL